MTSDGPLGSNDPTASGDPIASDEPVAQDRASGMRTAGAASGGDSAAFPEGVYCVRCGYHLRGTVGARCPECGYDLAGYRSPASGIPWSNRRSIGRVPAYLNTVWLVTVRTRKFCEEHAREVSYRDARLFQLVTVTLAFIPLAVALWCGVWYLRPYVQRQLDNQGLSLSWESFVAYRLIVENWLWPVVTICLWGCLIMVTGVPSYFFHPHSSPMRRQNAGVAMSHYACAPLSLMFVPIALALTMPGPVIVATLILMALLILLWWINLVRLARGMMPELRIRQTVMALMTPLLWLLLGFLILGAVLIVVFWCGVVLDSLR